MGRFDGRVALVTGAGSPKGIGFAAARLLGREGAKVAITSTTDRIQGRASRLEADGVEAAEAGLRGSRPTGSRRRRSSPTLPMRPRRTSSSRPSSPGSARSTCS